MSQSWNQSSMATNYQSLLKYLHIMQVDLKASSLFVKPQDMETTSQHFGLIDKYLRSKLMGNERWVLVFMPNSLGI